MGGGHRRAVPAARRAAAPVAALALAVSLAACTTTVAGHGRAVAARGTSAPSATASTSAGNGAAAGGVPSGAPAPTSDQYPNASPAIRSYLFARDASYAATSLTVSGTYPLDTRTVTVAGRFGFDSARGESVGSCTLTLGGAAAEVRGVGDRTWARAPAGFWTAYGAAAAAPKASGRWVAVAEQVTGVAACNNDVFFLGQFEPSDSDALTTGVEPSGGRDVYVITDATTGFATVIDRDSGRIIGIRTEAGDLTLAYPTGAVTVTAPTGAVAVAGI